MKIGDEVYVHGYINEIREDVVIIRNNGGYFGTNRSELVSGELRTRQDVIEAYDKVLEIIEKKKTRVYEKVKHRNLDAWERVYTDALDELEDATLALKEGEQE